MPPSTSQETLRSSLPRRVFVSHNYADVEAMEVLTRCWPDHVEPVVFPFREPDQRSAVSDGIVGQLTSCDAMVTLSSRRSLRSDWVLFERDYALRRGMRVLSFDPATQRFEEAPGEAVALDAKVVASKPNRGRAEALLTWLREERSFDLSLMTGHFNMGELEHLAAEMLGTGVLVWLLDEHTSAVWSWVSSVEPTALADMYWDPSRPHTQYDAWQFEGAHAWLRRHSLFARIERWELPDRSHLDAESRSLLGEPELAIKTWAPDLDIVRHDESGHVNWVDADNLMVRTTAALYRAIPFRPTDHDEAEDDG